MSRGGTAIDVATPSGGHRTTLRVHVLLRAVYLAGAAMCLFITTQSFDSGRWMTWAYRAEGVGLAVGFSTLALRPRVVLEAERVRFRGVLMRERVIAREDVREFVCGYQGVEIVDTGGGRHLVMLVAAKSHLSSLLGRTSAKEAALRRYLLGDAVGTVSAASPGRRAERKAPAHRSRRGR